MGSGFKKNGLWTLYNWGSASLVSQMGGRPVYPGRPEGLSSLQLELKHMICLLREGADDLGQPMGPSALNLGLNHLGRGREVNSGQPVRFSSQQLGLNRAVCNAGGGS